MKINLMVSLFILSLVITSYAADSIDYIYLPDPQIMDKNIKDSVSLLSDHLSNSKKKFPIQLILDTDNGNIKGLIVVYDKTISLSEAEVSINQLYQEWELHGYEKLPVKLWKVTPNKVAIQLSTTDNGQVQIIFLPIRQ